MDRMVIRSIVGSDGVLHLALPVGIDEANKEVQVTVESARPLSASQEDCAHGSCPRQGSGKGSSIDPTKGDLKSESRCRELLAGYQLLDRPFAAWSGIECDDQACGCASRHYLPLFDRGGRVDLWGLP